MGYQSEEIPYHKLTVEPVADTEMIEITVESTDAQFAADLANTLVQTFIEENQTRQAKRFRIRSAQLQAQISEIETEIGDLQARLMSMRDSTERGALETRISQLKDTLTRLSYVYQSVQIAELQSVDLVSVVEQAVVPHQPIKSQALTDTVQSAIMGAVLAAGA